MIVSDSDDDEVDSVGCMREDTDNNEKPGENPGSSSTSATSTSGTSKIRAPNIRVSKPLSIAEEMHFVEVIELAQQINALLDLGEGSETFMHGVTIDTLREWTLDAQSFLGLDEVYDDEDLASLELQDFKKSDCERFDNALSEEGGFDKILFDMKSKQCLKGQSPEQLREMLKETSNRHGTIDILQNGTRRVMVKDFKPNGGKETSLSSSYLKKRAICNHTLRKLFDRGQVAVFSYDVLQQYPHVLKELHTSTLAWADKPDKDWMKRYLGRTCLNASKRSKHFKSYNEMIDYTRSEHHYPTPVLPLLPDIAELACNQRDANPGKILAGATIDVTAAYNQCALTVSAAKMTATKIRVPNGVGGWMIAIVIYLVGIFGCSTAGSVYCVCAKTIHELHNARKLRSLTYIDDGLLIDTQEDIRESVDEYISHVEALFGKEDGLGTPVINLSKVNVWPGELIGIGWHLDFTTWTVQPKQRGMAKLLLGVFSDIPMGADTIRTKDLEKVAGLLTWYATGIPLGAKFVSSLHANKHHACPQAKRVTLTQASKDDLLWWRALMVVAYTQPRKIAASISAVRRNHTPDLYLVTDASSLVGGGAYVSRFKDGTELVEFSTRPVRWTRHEKELFIKMEVSINVLEYFIVIYHILLFGEQYRDSVVHVQCDNTSAISWIMKNKTKTNTAADALARIFSLFCLTHNIIIICVHIRGVDNTIADFRSRDLNLAAQEADEDLPTNLEEEAQAGGTQSRGSQRAKTCRELLEICLSNKDQANGQRILKVLTRLRSTRGAEPSSI